MANVERTLVLVKPDGVERGLIGRILTRIEERGFAFQALELREATRDVLDAHYAEHTAKPFYPGLVEYMTSGPVVAIVVMGAQAVSSFRSVAGATDPVKAAPGTIRGDFGRDWGDGEIRNLVHGSDSPENAEREIAIWFPGLARH
ncbi:MAG: nucleoside-diphosphate kinase [Bifidobacteriaceae bacterium]|jgi:nucleoside-diphosphate kinase|nr:nucleoside-diphosphate kinase [Bifidobacteriaceae bacterium]